MDEYNDETMKNDLSGQEGVKAENAEASSEDIYGTGFCGGMTDEEIRRAAENIGPSPYASYEEPVNSDRRTADFQNGAPYTSYSYGAYEDRTYAAPKKSGIFKKIMKFAGIAAAFGILAGGTFFGSVKLLDNYLGDDSYLSADAAENAAGEIKALAFSNLTIASTDTTNEKPADNNVVVDVVKENMSCCVCINSTFMYSYWGQRYTSTGGGSGFIVGKNDTDLLIATCNHVVEEAYEIKVVLPDGTTVSGTIKANDANQDLAIVSVPLKDISEKTMSALTCATLGSSDDTQVGEMVIAIGNALNYGPSVTVGYLSAKNRQITIDGITMTVLQTDAAINGGNSGGPLFNVKGEVIGINSAKLADTDVEGICYAIPVSSAIPYLDDMMTEVVLDESEWGWIGITMGEEDPTTLGMPSGAYISEVSEGGPADKAGIYAGDIITAINGKTVPNYTYVSKMIHAHRIGETVSVTVSRREKGRWNSYTIDVVLESKEAAGIVE